MDAKNHAEDIRDEFGIIGNIHNMYTDTNTLDKGRHKALTHNIESQVAHMCEFGQAPREKIFRIQERLANERAYSEPAQPVIRPGLEASTQDAGEDDSDTALPTIQMQPHESVAQAMTTSHRRHQLSEILEEAEHHHIKAVLGSSNTGEVPAKVKPKNRHMSYGRNGYSDTSQFSSVAKDNKLESTISLTDLRHQLLVLMEDDVEHNRHKGGPVTTATRCTPSPSASSQSSVSTEATEEVHSNLQKIVIEWNGRRYPVLIGERGKIWEGPCTRESCQKHGRQSSRCDMGW